MIDLLLTRQPHRITYCTALPFESSDHCPVQYYLDGRPAKPTITRFSYQLADWKQYKQEILRKLPQITPLRTMREVDDSIAVFSQIITDAANASIPKFAPLPPCLKRPPKHIMDVIALRHTWINRWHRTRDRQAKRIVNSLTGQIRNLMRNWKTSVWNDKLLATHGDFRKFWRLVKTTRAKSTGVRIHTASDLLSPPEQTQLLADYYATKDNFCHTWVKSWKRLLSTT